MLEVLWLTCSFQVFKGSKPLVWTRLSKAAIVGHCYTMYAAALTREEIGKRKIADLGMDAVDTAIELDKRGSDEFIACGTPIFCQYCRGNIFPRVQHVWFVSRNIMHRMFPFQAHGFMRRVMCLRGDQHDNLLAAEWQFEGGEVGK